MIHDLATGRSCSWVASSQIGGLAYRSDGSEIAVGLGGSRAKCVILDAETAAERRSFSTPRGQLHAWSPDGASLVIPEIEAGKVDFFNASTGQRRSVAWDFELMMPDGGPRYA